MRKILMLVVVISIITATFFIYRNYQYRESSIEKNIMEIVNIKEADITEIVLTCGAHPIKATYKDKNSIDKFLKLVKGNVVVMVKEPKLNNGWGDEIEFYSKGKSLGVITSSLNQFCINGKWYEIVQGSFDEHSINNLLTNGISKK